LDRKIDFALIGTQRGGTSALNFYLKKHPDIGMATRKEVHFFDNERIFLNPSVDYSLYHKYFNFSESKDVYGESTPIYLYWKPAIRRIWEYNEKLKLVIILRNPIDRAFSHWRLEVGRNSEQTDFLDAIKNESYREKEAMPLQHRVYSYVDRGFYTTQIMRVLNFYKKNQLLIIKYDDFKLDQEATLNSIFQFLHVDPDKYRFGRVRALSAPPVREITMEERQFLLEVYSQEINKLEYLLDWDCTAWKE